MRIQFDTALTMVRYILKQSLFVGLHPGLTYNYKTVLPPSAALTGSSDRFILPSEDESTNIVLSFISHRQRELNKTRALRNV